ncbi:MAG: potassium transporter [Acidobacteria bacterium]|nr:MAG: potassium transporter [Acidobacteriota bacterium]
MSLTLLPQQRSLRRVLREAGKVVRADVWFPHIPLALLCALAGILVLGVAYRSSPARLLVGFPGSLLHVAPSGLILLIIGFGLLVMSAGLALRSRFAWIVVLVLSVAAILALWLFPHIHQVLLLDYLVALLVLLILAHGSFSHSSIAAGTIFAVISSLLLLLYAVFGALYFGNQFNPPIHDPVTALYYAIVTMGTVGYGDITPHTLHAKLFTVSIIVLGIAVFATSITAVVGPLVSGSFNRILNRKEVRMHRTDHFVVVGLTPLAISAYRELKRRHQSVVVIAPQTPPTESEVLAEDTIVGDANSTEVLEKASARQARAVLAMRPDDSDNAFTVLAVKELKGSAQTVIALNDSQHLGRIRLVQPDLVIAPQALGGEILAMALSGEAITGDTILERFLHYDGAPPL